MMRVTLPGVLTGALAAGMMAVPLMLDDANRSAYILCLLAVVVVVGLSLLMGHAGQASFGQAAYYAIGAYTAALVALAGVPTWIALLLSPVISACVALAIGLALLRLRGFYLSFATIALHLILLALLGSAEWAGGDIGLPGIPKLSVFGFTFDSALKFSYLAFAAVASTLFFSHRLVKSRFGRGFRSLSTSEAAAESCGVPVFRFKVLVFTISAALAGMAGGLYAFFVGYVSPGSFPLLLSFQFVVMSLIGGARSWVGPAIGGALLSVLMHLLNVAGTLPGMPVYAPTVLTYGAFGALVILFAIFFSDGLSRPLLVNSGRQSDEKRGLFARPRWL
jgi:branched-chain amino acid transport system permease protein